MVSWEQRVIVGDAKFDTSQDLTDFPYDEYAKMIGLEGIKIKTKEEVESGLERAFQADKPVVVNVYTDPLGPVSSTAYNLSANESLLIRSHQRRQRCLGHDKANFQRYFFRILKGK